MFGRKMMTGVLVASAFGLVPLAARADCVSFLNYYATAPYHQYDDDQTAWTCENEIGLVALCQRKGARLAPSYTGPLGRLRYACEYPSQNENVWEQASAIFKAVRDGVVTAVPYVIDGITGLTCLGGDPISCGIIGNQILNAVHHDNALHDVMGGFAAGAACLGEDVSGCAEALFGAFASSASNIPGPVGDFARHVNGVEKCVNGDGAACLALGTQLALDQTGLGISLGDLGDAMARLKDCSNGDFGSCAFLGENVAQSIHAGRLADDLLHGASGALACVLNNDPKACLTLAGQAAGVPGVDAMVGDAGACFGQSATIAACHQLAFDVANAAGAGGKLRDLSLLAEDTAACGNGDTVACVSLGAHATDALAARGQPGDQPAGTGGVQRCGHADPAACATYGAAITAREKESNRNALLDVASCRLFGGDLSSNACAYLGWAAARAADQLLPGTRAALCLTEGIPSSLPPAAQPANAELSTFGSSTHLYVVQTSPGATGSTTGSYVGQISPVVVPASSNSGGMVGQISPGLLPPTPPSTPSNQLYPGYGHGCELFGRDLAGTAGPVEVSGLREKIAIAVKAARQNDGSVRLVGAATSAAATKAGASTSKHNIRPE